jgi:hypothetical protein
LGRQLECPAGRDEHEKESSEVLTQSWPI